MDTLFSVLQRCPLFDGILPEEMEPMLSCLGARTVSVRKGEFLFREGDPAIYVGVLLSGSVQLIREDYYGNRSIMTHMGPGQVFGETYACSGQKSLPISIAADTDCSCLLIDCRRITVSCTNACAFHSRVIFNLLRLVAEKNLILHQKIQVISQRTTREKLMAYLMQEAKAAGRDTFTIPYDRQELADYLEVDRSGLSAEISKLRREGKLLCDRNRFRLLDAPLKAGLD